MTSEPRKRYGPGQRQCAAHHAVAGQLGERRGRRSAEVDPGLDEQLIEFAYGFYASRAHAGILYVNGWFAAPTRPLPEGATPLE